MGSMDLFLLLHIGVEPNRADKFHNRFGELLDYLAGKGYQFMRMDDLHELRGETNSIQISFLNPNGQFRRR